MPINFGNLGDACTSAKLLNQMHRRATFVRATLKWMQGASFEECSDAAGGPEYDGILARVLRRTHLMLKQLGLAFQLFLGWVVMFLGRFASKDHQPKVIHLGSSCAI